MTPHIYQVFIRATPQQVWQAITDPTFTHRYFHGIAFTSTLEPGSAFRHLAPTDPNNPTDSTNPTDPTDPNNPTDPQTVVAVDGTIEVADPPHRLVHTWHALYDPAMADEPHSRVEWLIDQAGPGLTRLRVEHSDLAFSPNTWQGVRDGWVWILDGLKTLLETGAPLPDQTVQFAVPSDDVAADWHRAQGIECNNGCWEMIEADRNAANDEELLRRAYASAYHWQRAARRTPTNEVRALWMLAKAHLIVGGVQQSLHYANACMALTVAEGLADFDLAYAHECLARALRASGDHDRAALEWAAAKAVSVADPQDRAIVDADLATGP